MMSLRTTAQSAPTARPPEGSNRLSARAATLAYDGRTIASELSLEVPAGEFTVVVGPNACGKSTLLRALSRLHRPAAGSIVLDGEDIHSLDTKSVARRVGLLPQSAIAPERMVVRDLVARGRSPHQGLFRQWSEADHRAVQRALELTGTTELAARPVDELSGGQRQRVWLALVLAQDTETILLDEPTTFLDLAHQLDILGLCRRLRGQQGRTVVAVLHDLNQAARYGTHLVAMNEGRIVAAGPPSEVVTSELVREVFGVEALVTTDPVTGTPLVVPYERDPEPAPEPAGPASHGAPEPTAD
ncbi:MAG: ABC transporter ATP-binding protein [Arthrobacter sp.]|jgi:iron complex transport system ATP-binding protein|nr:ABC transporter ATP-binding protein [Arthrobacter sp.]